MNVYDGFRLKRGVVVRKNNRQLSPARSQAKRNHSPDGFEWGYCGSGPAQLALAILLEEVSSGEAMDMYQQFKKEVIAGLQKHFWSMTSADVLKWLAGVTGPASSAEAT